MNPKYKNTKNIVSSSDRQGARAERHKYLFELMKHMTTLSSGSVLLLVTFLEKILHDKAPPDFIRLAFGGFCISILTALSTMLILTSNFGEKFSEWDKNYFSIVAVVAIMGFFIGMSSLMIAVFRSY